MGQIAPFIPMITSVVSAGVGIAGKINQANSAAEQANYMTQVARMNQANSQMMADAQEQAARAAEQKGLAEEQKKRQQTSQLIGSKRAQLASQGSDINDGSAVDIIGDTARAGEVDALNIRSDTAQDAWLKRVQAASTRNQASASGLQADMYTRKAASTMSNLPLSLLGGGKL